MRKEQKESTQAFCEGARGTNLLIRGANMPGGPSLEEEKRSKRGEIY